MVDHGYESTGMPPLLLGCAVSLQLVGGLAVLVGFCRFGVALLVTFLLPVSAKDVGMHASQPLSIDCCRLCNLLLFFAAFYAFCQVTLIMHNPVVDKSFHSEQFTHFMKNLSILGGLMVLASCGDAPTAGRVAEGAVEGAHAGRGAHRSGIKKRS